MSLVLMGSTSGSITLQEPAVAGSTVLSLPATTGTVGLTTSQIGMKNRIINGAMVIDQRNAGASITPTTNVYALDRWNMLASVASKFSVQQVTDAPAGFVNSMRFTSLSAYTPASSDIIGFDQRIEGFNIADLNWGTANARAATLSFWVKSSLTGTFGGNLRAVTNTPNYPFTYSISAANTWEYKTVSIAAPTTGTFQTTNLTGVIISFGLGVGSTFNGTADGTWKAGDFISATGSVNLVATNGATLFITGVQLELGSAATTFDFRSIGTELALCQRYYEVTDTQNLVSTDSSGTGRINWQYKVTKRATPTIGGSGGIAGTAYPGLSYLVVDSASAGALARINTPTSASAEL